MTKVLLVDDEPGYRASIEFFLKQAGNQVQAVSTARDALEVAADFQPDVLVADWLLGERLTGADLASQLSTQLPDLQVILITGLSAEMVRKQVLNLAVFRVIEKPFEPRQLIDAVRDAWTGRDTTQGFVGS